MQPDGTFTIVVGAALHAGSAVTGAPVPGHFMGAPLDVVAVVVVVPVAVVDVVCMPVEVVLEPVVELAAPPPPVELCEEEQPASTAHAARKKEAFGVMASLVAPGERAFYANVIAALEEQNLGGVGGHEDARHRRRSHGSR
jgi:hypothetical protein